MTTKKISFVIVNYNTKDLLHKCVANLIDIWPNIEIFIVDNGSKDGSAENIQQFEEKYAYVTLIRTENNGISAAHNLALKKATGDYICYLGTDAFPDKEAIKNMFGFGAPHVQTTPTGRP